MEISAVILAGGLARRMGGVDKGLQLYQGVPLFWHCYQRLKNQVAEVAVNANRNQAIYRQSGHGNSKQSHLSTKWLACVC